jgi:hypothetical protein
LTVARDGVGARCVRSSKARAARGAHHASIVARIYRLDARRAIAVVAGTARRLPI